MPTFKVRCVNRQTAKPYDSFIEAQTPIEAVQRASEKHLLCANHDPELVQQTDSALMLAELVKMNAELAAIKESLTPRSLSFVRSPFPSLTSAVQHAVVRAFLFWFGCLIVFYLILAVASAAVGR